MGVDNFVGGVVEVFVFDGYVDDSGSGSFYDRGAVANSLVCYDVGVAHLSLPQRLIPLFSNV